MMNELSRRPLCPAIVTCILIGLCFLLTGSVYLTWIHRLSMWYDADTVYLLSESFGGYLPQILGLALWSLFIAKDRALAFRKQTLTLVLLLYGLMIAAVCLGNSGPTVLTSGILMTFAMGLIAGAYLSRLARFVPAGRRGTTFAVGCSLGSVGSWLLSFLGGGSFLADTTVIWIYFALVSLAILIVHLMADEISPDQEDKPKPSGAVETSLDTGPYGEDLASALKASLLLGAVIVFAGFANQTMFCTGAFAYLTGQVSWEAVRAFHAVGLIAAGILNDLSRRTGLVMVLASFIFSIVALPLSHAAGAGPALAALGYVLQSFLSVFRAVAFADLYDRAAYLLPLSVLGLAFGRLGEALGAYVGWLLAGNELSLALVSSGVFLLLLASIFALFKRDYLPQQQAQVPLTREQRINELALASDLSRREREVLELIMARKTNLEISEELVISANTVKTHVRNVLRKTDCKDRAELRGKVR